MTAATSSVFGTAVSVPKSLKLNQMISVPQSVKDIASWSCSAGVITGVSKDTLQNYKRQEIVHNFVNGASYTICGVIGTPFIGIGYNRVKPIVDKNNMVYGSTAHEVVVGSSGINLNLAGIGQTSGEKYD